ncbi:MAG: twin-arginine translocase subunit TatC [Pseudomonadota bacterium]
MVEKTQALLVFPAMSDEAAIFWAHVGALRTLLLRCMTLYACIALPFIYYASAVFTIFLQPFHRLMPQATLVTVEVTTPFTVPLKCACLIAWYIGLPLILWQIWRFIAQGLYAHERARVKGALVASLLLFYLGFLLAYYLVCPLALQVLAGFAPQGVWVLTDIRYYTDFVFSLTFAFGFAFQMPLAIFLAHQFGLVTVAQIRAARRYVIVAAFVVGMLLTPPDVFSQIALAVPLWGLYELALGLLQLREKRMGRNGQNLQV